MKTFNRTLTFCFLIAFFFLFHRFLSNDYSSNYNVREWTRETKMQLKRKIKIIFEEKRSSLVHLIKFKSTSLEWMSKRKKKERKKRTCPRENISSRFSLIIILNFRFVHIVFSSSSIYLVSCHQIEWMIDETPHL